MRGKGRTDSVLRPGGVNRRRSGGPPPPLLQKCRVRCGQHAVVVRVHVACQARCVCMCMHELRLGEVLEEPLGLLRLALGLRRNEHVRKHARSPATLPPTTQHMRDEEMISLTNLLTAHLLRHRSQVPLLAHQLVAVKPHAPVEPITI